MRPRSHSRPGRKFTWVPTLEALEDRTVPVATVTQVGNQITITGDNSADLISITDNGTNGAGAITITGLVTGQTSSLPISSGLGFVISINTLGGDDLVVYNLVGSLNVNPLTATAGRSISCILGAGNDTFRFSMIHDVVNSTPGNGLPTGIANGASLFVAAYGNTGIDTIGMRYLGFLGAQNLLGTDTGNISFTALGGKGNDGIMADVNVFVPPFGAPNGTVNGTVTGTVFGGPGSDTLGLIRTLPPGYPITGIGTLSGDSGVDSAFTSSDIVVASIEKLFVVF